MSSSRPVPLAQPIISSKKINHIYDLMSDCKLMEAQYETGNALHSALKRHDEADRSWAYAIFAELELRSPSPRKDVIREDVERALEHSSWIKAGPERTLLKSKCAKILLESRGQGKRDDAELASALEKLDMSRDANVKGEGAGGGGEDDDGGERDIVEICQRLFAADLEDERCN